MTVLDYGCGSGILGLAALKFGATQVTATDIDRDSLLSALRNAEMNELKISVFLADEIIQSNSSLVNDSGDDSSQNDEKFILLDPNKGHVILNETGADPLNASGVEVGQASFPSVVELQNKQFDLVVANIYAPVLVRLAERLSHYVSHNGKLALSGIKNAQAEKIVDVYRKYFNQVTIEGIEGEWILISCSEKIIL